MLNYRHLYYFWVVSKEGGFARAAERMDMAIQTISAQVRELEKALGHQLLKPAGRGVAMTEAGQAAFARAEEIFQIGQVIPDEVREAASGKVARLAVGLSDGMSKLAAHALLAPVLDTPALRLVCHEGSSSNCWAELALHHLDLVLAGQPAPRNPNLRLTSERLVESTVDWYGPAAHVHKADVDQFPQSLNRLPVLLPTGHSPLRPGPGSMVRGRAIAAAHRRRVRRQRAAGGICCARAGGVSGQPPWRRRRGLDAWTAFAGTLRRRERGSPRHPLTPRATSPSGAAGHRCGAILSTSAQGGLCFGSNAAAFVCPFDNAPTAASGLQDPHLAVGKVRSPWAAATAIRSTWR
jgi:DNA-binding transcriptional LysR family regulator